MVYLKNNGNFLSSKKAFNYLFAKDVGFSYDEDLKTIQYLSNTTDITTIINTKDALEKEKNISQLYFKISGSIFLQLNKYLNIEFINKRGCKILGYKLNEIKGKNWFKNFVSAYHSKELQEKYQEYFTSSSNELNQIEFPILTKNGQEKIIYWRNSRLYDADKNVTSIICAGEDITHRKQINDSVMKAMIEGREIEKNRIAKDLHDGLGQLITAINLNLKALEDQYYKTNYKIPEPLLDAINLTTKSIHEIKYISKGLISYELKDFGMINALESLFSNISHTNIMKIDFQHTGIQNKRFKVQIETYIYRITQEILSNTIKHSKAKNFEYKISYQKNRIHIIAKDNGIGFNKPFQKMQNQGMGLKELETRIKLINGILNIDDTKGVCYTIEIPAKIVRK